MSWFPKLSPDGSRVVGGAGTLWLDGKPLPVKAHSPTWATPSTIIYAAEGDRGLWRYFSKALPSGDPVEIRKPSGRNLVVHGARYAFQLGEAVIYFDGVMEHTIPDAAAPALTDAHFAYVTPFHDANKRVVVDGAPVHHARHIVNLAGSGKTFAWDEEGASGYWQGGKVTRLPTLPMWNRSPQPIGDRFILSGTHPGFIIRDLANPTKGFVFENGGQCYYPDAALIGNRIRVVFTNERGVLDETWVEVSQLTADLIASPTPAPAPRPPTPASTSEPPPVAENEHYQIPNPTLALYRDVVHKLGQKHSDWRTSQNDDDRRKLAKAIVQTLLAKTGDPRWVWKSAHSNLASPSKDVSAYVLEGTVKHGARRKMAMFDMVDGASRVMNLHGKGEVGEQYVIVVEPFDHLAEVTLPAPLPPPPPPEVEVPETPPPPPPPKPDLAVLEILFALKVQLDRIEAQVNAPVPEPPAPVVTFPPYEGHIFGRPFTLVPKP